MTKPNNYIDRVPVRFHNKPTNPFIQVITNGWFISIVVVLVVLLFMFGDKIF